MDKLDYLILGELLLDAQTSFLQIAKKLKISSFTVKSRYDKMVQDGVIFRSTICINLSKLGYQGKVFLLITNAANQTKKVTVEALKKMRNIVSVSEIIGPFDIIAVAPITDYNSIKNLVSQVKEIPSVQRVSITCINETSFPLSQNFGKILSQASHELAETNKE
ncbi:MAG: Lrp/AsnC family transcriptional regulator [Candidatus Bathyarchaeia archaeon]|jgi:Lrp/AsnC family transcriptional regulator for asnA, asnC and gidA